MSVPWTGTSGDEWKLEGVDCTEPGCCRPLGHDDVCMDVRKMHTCNTPAGGKLVDMTERCWSCEKRGPTLTIACKSCHLRYAVCTTRSCWSAVHMDRAAHFAVPGPLRCAGDKAEASTPMPPADDEEFDEGQDTPVEIPRKRE